MAYWNGKSRLTAAILVDVDGTLASAYRGGRRELRPSAMVALDLLSEHAPVFLWSVAGADNGDRLMHEFPGLTRYVQSAWMKSEFPLDKVDHPYCIDDMDLDDEVHRCTCVILNETWDGGADSGDLVEASQLIADDLAKRKLSPIASMTCSSLP